MPKAAHNKSDNSSDDSDRSEYSRVECLRRSASINGLPPVVLGGGSTNCPPAESARLVAVTRASKTEPGAEGPIRFIIDAPIPGLILRAAVKQNHAEICLLRCGLGRAASRKRPSAVDIP